YHLFTIGYMFLLSTCAVDQNEVGWTIRQELALVLTLAHLNLFGTKDFMATAIPSIEEWKNILGLDKTFDIWKHLFLVHKPTDR
ncbi:hypothetical protein ACJX0J_037216, partial [Zea mays]